MSKELNELITEMGQLFEGYAFTEEELNKLEVLYAKLKVVITKEFEYPFKKNEPYEVIFEDGRIVTSCWTNHNKDCERYEQGNVFKTREEAERERDKRALLKRFRQFRDKCNGNWKPDFKDSSKDKYIIYYDYEFRAFFCSNLGREDEFHLFSYFKNQKDCKRAIELFGDEIKKLYVESEYE